MEQELTAILGADELKNVGEAIAEILRAHNLHRSPDVCRKLFLYLSGVVDGWNLISGQSCRQ